MIGQLVGFLLLFFLTGITLIYAVFPRKGEIDPHYDGLYRLTFGVLMSIVILVLFGFALNALGVNQDTGMGYVTSANIWLGLGLFAIVFFIVGWWRGAYPILGRIHKSLLRFPKSPTYSVMGELDDDRAVMARFQELAQSREKLRRQLKDMDRRIGLQSGSLKEHYVKKRDELLESIKGVDTQLKELEERRSALLYVK